jgi:hypothetical protein
MSTKELLTEEECTAVAAIINNPPKDRSLASALKPILNAEPTATRLLGQGVLPDYLAYYIEYTQTLGRDP